MTKKCAKKLLQIALKLRCFCTFSVFILLNFLTVVDWEALVAPPLATPLEMASNCEGVWGSTLQADHFTLCNKVGFVRLWFDFDSNSEAAANPFDN